MRIIKSISIGSIAILIALIYFYASSQLKERDEENYIIGFDRCQAIFENENAKVQNEIIKENKAVNHRKQTNIIISVDDDLVWLQNNACIDCSNVKS